MNDLWRALRYLRKYWGTTLGAFLSLLIVTATNLFSPQLLRLVLVSPAKWKRPVERVHEVGREGNEVIWAPNGQNESSPIGWSGLWSGLHFATQTSASEESVP